MIIDGRKLAQELNAQTQARAATLSFTPLLCDVIVGDDAASLSYVGIKQRTAEKYGLQFQLKHLSANTTTEEIIAVIKNVQANPDLCGLIVQLPLPAHLASTEILTAIDPGVDVDLLNPQSAAAYYRGEAKLIPPTAGAIMQILNSLAVDLQNLSFAVVGQGDLVGRPITYLLQQQGYQVEIVTRETVNQNVILSNADVIISGAGQPGIITGESVKDGAIVIDAGTSESGGSIKGDVDFDSVNPKARLITPVPGGVGPVTVAKLLENVIIVAESRA